MLALYGAVLATITATAQIISFLRDRANVKVTYKRNMTIVGHSDASHGDVLFTILRAANAGRRPVTITGMGGYRLHPRKGFICRLKRGLGRRVLVNSPRTAICYADHVEGSGRKLFARACELDLEGIVAKHKFAPHVTDREQSSWFKIRNPRYSQWAGREELFERERHEEPTPGWHTCELACAGVED